jgi:MFS transporter, DHA3 family, macrolide efflux protein
MSTTATAQEAATAAPAQMNFREVLRIEVMRRVWYAQVISLFGDFLALFAVIAVVSFRMNGTPAQVTGIQIAYMLPIVFIGPIAGVFVDRWPLKPTLVASDLIRAVLAVMLIVTTQVWQVYLVLAALSCVSAFFGPAQTVTIRTHVPPNGLVASNALMQFAFMGSRIVGPAVAGTLVGAFGPAICYAVDVVSFIGSAALIGSVVIRRALAPKSESSSNRIHAIWIDMGEGTSFIFHHAALLFVVLSMAAGLFTIGCFAPLISIFVRDTLHASELQFGVVSAMVGVGMIAGTQVIRPLSEKMAHDTLVLSGLAGIGVGVFLLGAVPFLPATLAATFAVGFSFTAIMVPAQTLMQRETPHEMLGRVASTQISVIFLAQILGLVLSGMLAQIFGVRMVFFLCAVLSIALVGGGRLFLRAKAA